MVFEGLDGSGSSTQSALFAEHLRGMAEPVVETAEPSLGPLGAVVRQALQSRLALSEEALALAFASDRLDHLFRPADGITHHVSLGRWVVCDRYVMSSYVYQTVAGLDLTWVKEINRHAIEPDLTVFVDVPIDLCMTRISQRLSPSERYEKEGTLRAALSVYRSQLAERPSETVVIMSGQGTRQEVHDRIWSADAVTKVLANRGLV